MSGNLSEMLRSGAEETSDDSIECRRCGELIPKESTLCPKCNESPRIPTLREWGQKLPIGIINHKSKTLGREFTVRKVDFKVEKDISDFWTKYRKMMSSVSLMDYLPCVLSFVLTTLDGQNIQKFPPEKRMAMIRQMFLGDIFYAYAWARIEALGPDFTLKLIECPICNHKFDFPVDLTTLEVNVREKYEDLTKRVVLRDGFNIGEKHYDTISMMPYTFDAISGIDMDNSADGFAGILKACVSNIEGMPEGAVITDSEISQMSKYDMALIDSKVDFVTGGPDWTVEIKCPKPSCGYDWFHAIDWTYASFFALSSRSMRRRRSRT